MVSKQARLPFPSSKSRIAGSKAFPNQDRPFTSHNDAPADAKGPQEPPKKVGKLTEAYGEPPALISRQDDGAPSIYREALLGEGGFARVYACVDSADGVRKALKVISKQQLKTSKNRLKLFAEIKLHQAMGHANIVMFEECFEDDENVYMVMELCSNGSLLDLLKRRRRYSEAEARFYLVQLLAACDYMHGRCVIHRDLKLGNLFLDKRMNLKVGDFGLAALVHFVGERKKTVCGTPNYIAPEILFDRDNGHSYEVDIWSIGVILYTFLVGRPPFQTKDVKAIYAKIKDGAFSFPPQLQISEQAVSLISMILDPVPAKRPSLQQILCHDFFHPSFPFPRSISTLSIDRQLDYSHLSVSQNEQNLRACLANAKQLHGQSAESHPTGEVKRQQSRDQVYQDPDFAEVISDIALAGPHVTEVAQAAIRQVAKAQESEVRSALAPDSPISELLNSARKPLVVSPAPPKRTRDASGRQPMAFVSSNPTSELVAPSSPTEMAAAPKRTSSYKAGVGFSMGKSPKRNTATATTTALRSDVAMGQSASSPVKLRTINAQGNNDKRASTSKPMSVIFEDPVIHLPPSGDIYESCWTTLAVALAVRNQEALSALYVPIDSDSPKVFISSWVDYAHKYGTAYQLTDGTAGVSYNDLTTMVMSPNQERIEYIFNKRGRAYNRRNHAQHEVSTTETRHKLDLLNHFRNYMIKQLERDATWTFVDETKMKEMDFLIKFYRMKTAMIFRLSNDALQFNFFADHTKLVLTENGNVVTFITADYRLKTYTLAKLIYDAARLGLIDPAMPEDQYDFEPAAGTNPDDPRFLRKQKTVQNILTKLVYCMDVLKGLTVRPSDDEAMQ